MGVTDLEDSQKDMRQIGSRVDDLTRFLTTSSSESTLRVENRIQSTATSLESSIRDEIHRTVSSILRESTISRASLETLSNLVSEMVISRFESLTSDNHSNYSKRVPSTKGELMQKTADGPQTDSVEYATSGSQATGDEFRNEDPEYSYRDGTSSRLVSRTSVQRVTSCLGTLLIRRSTLVITFSGFDPGLVSERAKVEIDFIPASWLRSWTGCDMFLARMGFQKPKVDFSFAIPRIVDEKSDPHIRTFAAVQNGDADTLRELFRLKVAYPTDRNVLGESLLNVSGAEHFSVPLGVGKMCLSADEARLHPACSIQIAATSGQLGICQLLLQQGADVDINTPTFGFQTWAQSRLLLACALLLNLEIVIRSN